MPARRLCIRTPPSQIQSSISDLRIEETMYFNCLHREVSIAPHTIKLGVKSHCKFWMIFDKLLQCYCRCQMKLINLLAVWSVQTILVVPSLVKNEFESRYNIKFDT